MLNCIAQFWKSLGSHHTYRRGINLRWSAKVTSQNQTRNFRSFCGDKCGDSLNLTTCILKSCLIHFLSACFIVHKAGREELEGALSLLEKVLCLLPELITRRWQLHSLTRIFSKLLHSGNSQKLRAEAVRYLLRKFTTSF